MIGLLSLIILTGALCIGLYGLSRLPDKGVSALTDKVERLLPQTQCAQCGYAGCRPYAQAIVDGAAEIDLCPPGGDTVVQSLAELLNCSDTLHSDVPHANLSTPAPVKAEIDEEQCIGCALCLPVCPVDAIVGAPQYLHTVLSEQCTGCELCVAPCPVDCIRMHTITEPPPAPASAPSAALPCIHCGACDSVCPEHLHAKDLYHHIRMEQWDTVDEKNIIECTECDLCVPVCPSHIPLSDFYRYAKQKLQTREQSEQLAAEANARYQRHLKRHTEHRATDTNNRDLVKAELMQKIRRKPVGEKI